GLLVFVSIRARRVVRGQGDTDTLEDAQVMSDGRLPGVVVDADKSAQLPNWSPCHCSPKRAGSKSGNRCCMFEEGVQPYGRLSTACVHRSGHVRSSHVGTARGSRGVIGTPRLAKKGHLFAATASRSPKRLIAGAQVANCLVGS